ncbi:hypothetical protein ACFX1S_044507 [Malus domestica]
MDKLIIVWHWHAFGGNLYFRLSKFQREGSVFFYTVPHYPSLQEKKMLFQAGGQGTRPTFFEMEAAQQLPASLRATLTYSISVLALRRPFLHRVLDYDDEFFSLLVLVLETHSLRTTGIPTLLSISGCSLLFCRYSVQEFDFVFWVLFVFFGRCFVFQITIRVEEGCEDKS